MHKYEKPTIIINESLAEGVFAASGDHWEVTSTQAQVLAHENCSNWTIRVACVADNIDDESNKGVTLTFKFNKDVTVTTLSSGGFSASASSSGSEVTIHFSEAYCRYNQAQRMDCQIKVVPYDATILEETYSFSCSHP